MRKCMAKGWVGHPLVADYHVVSQNFRVVRHQNQRTERPIKAEGRGPPGTRIFGARRGRDPGRRREEEREKTPFPAGQGGSE